MYHVADGRIEMEMYELVADHRASVTYQGTLLEPSGFVLESRRFVDDPRFWLKRESKIKSAYEEWDVGPMLLRETDW